MLIASPFFVVQKIAVYCNSFRWSGAVRSIIKSVYVAITKNIDYAVVYSFFSVVD